MESVSDSAPLYPFLAPPRGYAVDPYRAIEFSSTANDCVTVTARRAIGGSISRVFKFSWYKSDTVVDGIRALSKEMGVRGLRSLSMTLNTARRSDPMLSPTTWLDDFGAAHQLKMLQAAGRAGMTLCMLLSASIEDGTWQRGGATGGAIVWPKLYRLKLELVPLAHRFSQEDGVEEDDESFGVSVGEVLLRELERRQERGAPLSRLKLLRCGATRHWLRKAEGLVGCVSAAGDEDMSEGEESGGA
ncbi:hypothetical protein FA95DRAFT_1284730 [Auriscalpium vulgare]|uniref:Uncharacterized protein n=1 Tax=Auriscalpium vulgare TaxID=40419 RepID=A0ACB8R2Q9_9AGAM|nr:hypothetical protein FA95DRAFT_1284730 [Auriscalpium vulgare]